MNGAQRKMIRQSRWLILLLLGIIVGGYFAYVGLVQPAIDLFNRPPNSFKYSSSTVQEVCNVLRLSPNDSFCQEPSSQNPQSIEAMLERNFPIGETKIDDLMILLADLPSRAGGSSSEGEDYEPNGCQTFLEGNYECRVIFPGDINIVSIGFARISRFVTYYRATKAGS